MVLVIKFKKSKNSGRWSNLEKVYKVHPEAEEFYFPGNEIGILVSHGFTGSTQSMRYLGTQIAKSGFTVYGPRLTGHGTEPEDMEQATYKDWISDVEKGLERLQQTCSKIFIIGLSMGGTLSLYLAQKYVDIAGIIPINAAVDIPNLKATYENMKNSGTRFIEGIGSDIKMAGVAELAYSKTPVKSLGDLITLMDQVRGNLYKVTVPTLIISSIVDHVVPPENSKQIYHSISTEDKSIVFLKNSYHVATLDNDKELIAKECSRFISNRV
jgi:carboxylesterase